MERPRKKFYTVSEAAQKLNLHPQTIRVWFNKGKIKGVKEMDRFSRILIPESELRRIAQVEVKRGKWKLGAKTKKNVLTDEEVSRLLKVCRGLAERLVVYVLLYTGMRVSEFIHMRRSWVDLKSGFIVIPESQPCDLHPECRKGREVKDWSTGRKTFIKNLWRVKVPDAARSIPILPEVRPVLEEFFSRYEAVSDLIPSRIEAWRIVKTVAKRAGLSKRVFPHVLRGTFASVLAGKDFDALSIQAVLGWRSVKTADEYIRISPQRLMKMMKEKW